MDLKTIGKVSSNSLRRLQKKFLRSRAFRNIVHRLKRAAAQEGVKLLWLLQKDYRNWHSSHVVSFREHPVVVSDSRADRLFVGVLRDDPQGAQIEFWALMVLHYRSRGAPGGHAFSLGRTSILDPKKLIGNGVEPYLLSARYAFFLPPWGRLDFASFPFAQQDPDFYRCIDVSLWEALDYLSRHLGKPRVPLGLMRAHEIRGRNLMAPAPGLVATEVTEVIALDDLTPVHYKIDPRPRQAVRRERGSENDLTDDSPHARRVTFTAFIEALHSYLDSQLPVVLVLWRRARTLDQEGNETGLDLSKDPEQHSVCVVGHTAYRPDLGHAAVTRTQLAWYRQEAGMLTTTTFMRELIVMDDDIGPYLLMDVSGPGAGPEIDEQKTRLWWESVERNATSFFVGLPPEVRMPHEHAFWATLGVLKKDARHQELYRQAFRKFWGKLTPSLKLRLGQDASAAANWLKMVEGLPADEQNRHLASHFIASLEKRQVVTGLYLEHAGRLRERVLADAGLDDQTKAKLLEIVLPKYLWVAELSTVALMRLPTSERRILGEVVWDPSGTLGEESLIFFRFPGVFFRSMRRAEPFAPWLHAQWTWQNFQGASPKPPTANGAVTPARRGRSVAPAEGVRLP